MLYKNLKISLKVSFIRHVSVNLAKLRRAKFCESKSSLCGSSFFLCLQYVGHPEWNIEWIMSPQVTGKACSTKNVMKMCWRCFFLQISVFLHYLEEKKRHIITLSPNSWGRGGGRHVTKVWPGSVSRMVIGVFQDRTGGCPFCPPVSSGTGTWCGAWVLHSHLGLCSESHVLRMAK